MRYYRFPSAGCIWIKRRLPPAELAGTGLQTSDCPRPLIDSLQAPLEALGQGAAGIASLAIAERFKATERNGSPMGNLSFVSLLGLAALLIFPSPGSGQTSFLPGANENVGRRGALDGVWLWTLPDTPNGLRPTQSWHATGSSPNGDIYVGGMDHQTNSALYQLNWQTGALRLVGDARFPHRKQLITGSPARQHRSSIRVRSGTAAKSMLPP